MPVAVEETYSGMPPPLGHTATGPLPLPVLAWSSQDRQPSLPQCAAPGACASCCWHKSAVAAASARIPLRCIPLHIHAVMQLSH
jgi:hypothetical protein